VAVLRELKEEAGGCKPVKVIDMKTKGKYKYDHKMADRPWIGQTYSLFAVEVIDCKRIKFDKKEHSGYRWLGFDDAYEMLTWPNQKKCLKIVHKRIKTK